LTPVQAIQKHREVLAPLLVTAALAWWWTSERMAGMNAAPGTDLGTLGWFTGSWVLMMAAMMLPTFAPTLAAYAALTRGRARSDWLLFTGGYLLVWALVGLASYAAFELGKQLLAGDLAWHRGGRWASAVVLAVAAAYEFAPFKRACLTRCRGQLRQPHGRPDRWSVAVAMGARSGGWCIGSSWALMAALFALGVMSLTWMAVIALLVTLEKVGPWPFTARLASAAVLAVLSLGILIAPHDVPGFVVPGSSGAMHAMTMIG
jgi:predicted metal-binding membrane protein